MPLGVDFPNHVNDSDTPKSSATDTGGSLPAGSTTLSQATQPNMTPPARPTTGIEAKDISPLSQKT